MWLVCLAPVCLYALPTMSGHAPHESADCVQGITPLRPCLTNAPIHNVPYVEREGQVVTSMPLSPRNYNSFSIDMSRVPVDDLPLRHFLCFVVNAYWAAQCWAVSTGCTKEHGAFMPPSWSLFVTVWSKPCTPVACWRSSCSSLHKGADISPAAGLFPFYSSVQLSRCVCFAGSTLYWPKRSFTLFDSGMPKA